MSLMFLFLLIYMIEKYVSNSLMFSLVLGSLQASFHRSTTDNLSRCWRVSKSRCFRLMASTVKVKGLLKGLRYISQIFGEYVQV